MFPFLELLFVYFSEQAEQEFILILVQNSWKAVAEYTRPGNRCCYKPALWALE